MIRLKRKMAVALGIILVWTVPVYAQGNAKQPVVNAATVSVDQTVLFVEGVNFGRSPSLTLGGVALGGVQVDASGGQIVAVMPAFPPGTYRLVVTTGNNLSAAFDMAIGAIGPVGPSGAPGPTGPAGAAGVDGATGPAGPAGPAGPTGAQGPAGDNGPAGATGAMGPAGPAGPTGAQGPAGNIGPAGATGAMGPAGLAGPTGAQGPSGDIGPAGATGPMGPIGLQGPVGPTGPTGPTGATTNYFAGWVRGTAAIRFGTGFSVARFGAVGSYRITIPATVTGRFLVTTVSPSGANVYATVVLYAKSAIDQSHTIDIEIHSITTGALVDSDFNFIAIDRS